MSDLELLKKYLQNEIDTGGNKIFVFDKDYNAIEFKTIDALNEINDLQSLLQQKENIIKEVREYVNQLIDLKEEDYLKSVSLIYIEKILEILSKVD